MKIPITYTIRKNHRKLNNKDSIYISISKLAMYLREKDYPDFMSYRCIFAIYFIFHSNLPVLAYNQNDLSFLGYGRLYSVGRIIKRTMIH